MGSACSCTNERSPPQCHKWLLSSGSSQGGRVFLRHLFTWLTTIQRTTNTQTHTAELFMLKSLHGARRHSLRTQETRVVILTQRPVPRPPGGILNMAPCYLGDKPASAAFVTWIGKGGGKGGKVKEKRVMGWSSALQPFWCHDPNK